MSTTNTTVTYLHPHMETRINDNSTVVEVLSSTGTATFMPYFSSRGVDGVIEEYNSYSQFIADKGTPNFKKHGQAIYNVLQFLSGGGTVYGMRLLPADATRANVFVSAAGNASEAKKQEVVENGRNVYVDADGAIKAYVDADGKIYDSAEASEVSNAVKSLDGLSKKMEEVQVSVVDKFNKAATAYKNNVVSDVKGIVLNSDGLVIVTKDGEEIETQDGTGIEPQVDGGEAVSPLLAIVCKGRGKYGNNYSVILKHNASLSEGYGVAIYELIISEKNNVIEGPYYVSLQPEAVNVSGASLYIKNVVETYSSVIDVVVDEDAYDKIMISLNNSGVAEEDCAKVDILGLAGNPINVVLAGGSDGSDLTDDIKEELLTKAFIHKNIVNKKRFPLDVLIDASFPKTVKDAMINLGKTRGDVFTFIDLGKDVVSMTNIQSSPLTPTVDDRTVAIYGQSLVVYDSFTNSDINVSMTYVLANKIPANDSNYGIQYPLAGPNRGVITGFKTLPFNPTPDEKESLYKMRVNYAEQDYRQTKLMSQLTSQSLTSALSNINNMRVLLRMVRTVEEISENYFFEFANATTLAHFEAAVNTYLSEWVNNGACEVCQGTVYQNDYDVVQRIVRVSIEVVFTGIIERIVIEFNVGSNVD